MTNHIRPFHTDRYLINLSKHIPQQRMKLFLALLFIIIIITLIYYCHSLRVCLHWGVRERVKLRTVRNKSHVYEDVFILIPVREWAGIILQFLPIQQKKKRDDESYNSNFLHVYVWNHRHVTTVHRHTVTWPSCFEPHFWAVFRNVRPSEVLLSVETSVSTILFSVKVFKTKKQRKSCDYLKHLCTCVGASLGFSWCKAPAAVMDINWPVSETSCL